MADFAKAQLLKYGWTEGKGLGKNENGITTAIRPTLKFDTSGIGHKHVDGNQWWETAYNKAANNIAIESSSAGVSFSVSEADTVKEKKSKKKNSKLKSEYGNFLKTSTLSNGALIPEKEFIHMEAESNGISSPLIQLTDDELFKACGGRTAHKGARHGLKLNGKLERIARQEQEMLSRLSASSDALYAPVSLGTNQEGNKKRCRDSDDEDSGIDSNGNSIMALSDALPDVVESIKLSKEARKKQNRKINDLSHQLNVSCKVEEDDQGGAEKIRKKRDKRCKTDNYEVSINGESEDAQSERRKGTHCKRKGDKKKHRKSKAEVTSTEIIARKLNGKIEKKKAAQMRKKMKNKLDHITEKKLESIVNNLEALQVTQNATEELKRGRGKTKKTKRAKRRISKERRIKNVTNTMDSVNSSE